MTNAAEEYLSLEEAAQRLGQPAGQTRRLGDEGQLPGAFQRLDDRAWQIPAAGVEAWIDRHPFSRAWLNRMRPRWRRLNKKVLGLPRVTVWGTLVLAMTLLGYYALLRDFGLFQPARQIDGEFHVAVAAFEVVGDRENRPMGRDLAQGVYLRMEEEFAESDPDFIIGLWGPDDVEAIRGATREERAESAAKTAAKIDADVLVYGVLDTTRPLWTITPEFYVSDANLTDAQEITGQHEMGRPFEATGQGSIATRISVSTTLSARAQLLSLLTVGLSHYAAHDYATAQALFEDIEREHDWSEMGGREVLYLLLGNAAGKNKDYDLAESAYQKALAENPDYSRAYGGLASVYYIRALQPAEGANDLAAIDIALITQSIATYEQAAAAPVRPALSDIETKVTFGLGQAYLALHLQDDGRPLAPAVQAFEDVIAEYGDGENERVRELAAESHARLGLIHSLSGDVTAAIAEYTLAKDLLYDRPARQETFEERIRGLQESVQ